ncbi:MAG: M48 family metallopeptidase [Chloroflexi bacterium]|nr:M48 family metallopeptidase [Chloroflexota bacterium]
METLISEESQKKARQYALIKRRLWAIELVLGAVFLLLLWLSGFSSVLRDLLPSPQPVTVALYFWIIGLGYGLLLAPLHYYEGFTLPHRFGLSHQTLKNWLGDTLKGGLIGLILVTAILIIIYQFMAHFPDVWWFWTAMFMVLVTVLLTHLTPLIIIPLFFHAKPIDDDLGQRLARLAERAQQRIKGVFIIDMSRRGTTANAALVGLGNTRRVLLGDTLLHKYSSDEIEVILAHELGHHAQGHITKAILARSLFTLLGFYLINLALKQAVATFDLQGIADIADLPVLALLWGLYTLVMQPIDNAFSRLWETSADQYAIKMTHNPQAFTSMLTKLTEQNLAEAQPSRWVEILFYNHPPYKKRVALAQSYLTPRA